MLGMRVIDSHTPEPLGNVTNYYIIRIIFVKPLA